MKKVNIDTNKVIQYYDTHSNSSTIKHFDISYDFLMNLLRDNNIDNHSRKENIRLTNLERYGTEKVPKEVEALRQQKIKQTCLERYGVTNVFQTSENSEKRNKAIKENNTERIKKIKQTKLNRYGDENYNNQEKLKQTLLDRYGVESTFQSDEVKEKIRQTCLEKYGVDNTADIPSRREKAVQTCLEKWGHDNYCNRIKFLATCELKYGGNPMQNVAIKEKSSLTIQDKYGVPWNCMREEARMKGNNSQPNKEFEELLKSYNTDTCEREFPLGNYSYDFKVGYRLIEIDPATTHNSTIGIYNKDPLDKYYHINKSKYASNNGYQCIHIWDWDSKDKIINQLLKEKERVYARNCNIHEVAIEEAALFINENHLQGYVKDSIRIGLYFENKLVSIMTFGKPRYNKKYEYELLRYCSSFSVIGGAEKLFKYFENTYNPKSVISYCDKSKFNGNVYNKLGFESTHKYESSKHWYNIKTKKHITDNLLRQRGFDQLFGTAYGKGTSNEDLMKQNGFLEIYDAGQETFTKIYN